MKKLYMIIIKPLGMFVKKKDENLVEKGALNNLDKDKVYDN